MTPSFPTRRSSDLLVPQHMMRTLYFTARTIPAKDLVRFGSVLEVVPREQLLDAALGVAGEIAAKDTRVIRAATEALNGIDPIDVNKSYRWEQGFTFAPDRKSVGVGQRGVGRLRLGGPRCL